MSEAEQPTIEDFYAFAAAACVALKLRVTEARLIRNCLWAKTQIKNGYFLSPPRTIPSAFRLIERGYIAKAPEQPTSLGGRMKDGVDLDFGITVLMNQECWAKLSRDAVATQKGKGRSPDQGGQRTPP